MGLFPEKYEFLVFSGMYGESTGEYSLEPIGGIVRFDKTQQYDMVAYPIEKKIHIPLTGLRS